jgi:tRNA A37 threonylcarbamoyladenosine dehydratase
MTRAFEGIQNLYDTSGYEIITNSHFLVIGIGGVGSWICESLARTGVKEITIVDMDEICVSNINRQLHSDTTTIGHSKTQAMAKRMKLINPDIKVNEIFDFFSQSSLEEILNKEYTYVFDAIDSLKNKALLIGECRKRNLPIITVGAAGGKIDASQIEIADINRTKNDKLLASVRKELRKNHGFWKHHNRPFKIPAVFSPEDAKLTEEESCDLDGGTIRNCQTGFGSASFVTGTFAFYAVSYVLKSLVNAD